MVLSSSAQEPGEWDDLAARLGGGFFHCHAHAMHESARPNVKPCFVKAFDEREECVGVALGPIDASLLAFLPLLIQIPDNRMQAATLALLNSGRAELFVSYQGETPINAAMSEFLRAKRTMSTVAPPVPDERTGARPISFGP